MELMELGVQKGPFFSLSKEKTFTSECGGLRMCDIVRGQKC